MHQSSPASMARGSADPSPCSQVCRWHSIPAPQKFVLPTKEAGQRVQDRLPSPHAAQSSPTQPCPVQSSPTQPYSELSSPVQLCPALSSPVQSCPVLLRAVQPVQSHATLNSPTQPYPALPSGSRATTYIKYLSEKKAEAPGPWAGHQS